MSEEANTMTATARAVLEYLAARHTRAVKVVSIAEWIAEPIPKVQAALTSLRGEGFVRYFTGHPGTWAVTPSGVSEIDAVDASIQRYRMALEAILVVTANSSLGDAPIARRLAKRALGRAAS
jgi:DNA-binding IclR family transcriptional regulator